MAPRDVKLLSPSETRTIGRLLATARNGFSVMATTATFREPGIIEVGRRRWRWEDKLILVAA